MLMSIVSINDHGHYYDRKLSIVDNISVLQLSLRSEVFFCMDENYLPELTVFNSSIFLLVVYLVLVVYIYIYIVVYLL